MPSWFFVITIFFLQEFASVTAVLALAYRSGSNFLALHLLWVAATVIDISIGYFLGSYLGKRVLGKFRFWHAVEAWVLKFENRIGKSGKSFSLVLVGFVLFPYLGGFLAAWMELPFSDVLLFVSIGNVLWYLFAWATVIGLTAIIPSIKVLIIALICVAIVVSLVFERLRRRIF